MLWNYLLLKIGKKINSFYRKGIHNTFKVIWSFGGQFHLFSPFAELLLEIEGFFFSF